MSNEGFNLFSSEATTNHKKRDGQTETNNQRDIVNPAENLVDEQRKNRGVHCEQTRKSDWEQPAWRKQSPHDCDDQAGRKNNGKKEGGGNASDGRGYKGHEGQRQCGLAQIR